MGTYNTEQKTELINFLKKNPQKSYTIDDISREMKLDPEFSSPPGKSTIYRLMPKLVENNTVKCFIKSAGEKATYQIVGGDKCSFHMHMKCTDCGKLLHMSNSASNNILAEIKENNDFDVDINQTLIFGKCAKCKKKGDFK